MSQSRHRKAVAKPPSPDEAKPAVNKELEQKVQRLQLANTLRQILLVVGLCAVAWFAKKTLLPATSTAERSNAQPAGQALPDVDGDALFRRSSSSAGQIVADEKRRDAVREAIDWSWSAYKAHAWGSDILLPVTQTGSNVTNAGSLGQSIVGSLSTLALIGAGEEYKKAREWVENELNFQVDAFVNTYTVTTSILGGLLSAYHLSQSKLGSARHEGAHMYLDKALELADRLMPAFDTPTGIPTTYINLAQRKGILDEKNNGLTSLGEAGGMALEFKYLSHITGDWTYWRKVEKVSELIRKRAIHDGVAPIYISPGNGQLVSSPIKLGGKAWPYYGNLVKQWVQTDRQEPVYRETFEDIAGGLKTHLLGSTKHSSLTFTQELHPAKHPQTGEQSWQILPRQDQAVCALSGSILAALSPDQGDFDTSTLTEGELAMYHLSTGLLRTCMKIHNTATGLAPDTVTFVQPADGAKTDIDWYINPTNFRDAYNSLASGTLESLLIAYRTTRDPVYREYAWLIFQGYQKHARLPSRGYAGVAEVQSDNVSHINRMDPVWLSSTLKTLYLIFDDESAVTLKDHVLTDQGHIMPVFEPRSLTPFSTS